MNLAFHDALTRLVDGRIRELEVELGQGNAGNHSEYERRVGHIAGLRDALGFADFIRKRMTEG